MYYHMKGSGIGQLSVSQKYPNNQRRNLFSRSGDQGDEWHSMEILLNDNSRAYKVTQILSLMTCFQPRFLRLNSDIKS